jgi:hypothetical protein
VAKRSVNREVRDLEQRLDGIESVQVFMHRVQAEELAKAERLRKLAVAVTNSQRFLNGTCRVSVTAARRLEEFLVELQPFYRPGRPVHPEMRKLLSRHRRSSR